MGLQLDAAVWLIDEDYAHARVGFCCESLNRVIDRIEKWLETQQEPDPRVGFVLAAVNAGNPISISGVLALRAA